jgi:diguanylate cyclase (GGDEF)-like protein
MPLQHAESLLRAGAHAEAVRELERFMAQPDLPEHLRLRALLLQAPTHQDAGHFEQALSCARAALDLARRLADRAQEAQALCSLSSAYLTIGLGRESFDAATRALTLARACHDKRVESQALLRMASFASDSGDVSGARHLLAQSLACAEAARSADDQFWALNNLSSLQGEQAALVAEGNNPALAHAVVDELVVTVDRALAISRQTGHWLQQAFAISNLADAYIVLKDSQRARELIGEYAQLARQHGFNRLLGYTHLDEARLLRSEGQSTQAIALLDSEAHRATLLRYDDLALSTEEALVQLHKDERQFEQALRHMEVVLRMQQTRLSLRADRQIQVLLAKLDVEQARAEAEQLALRARSLELERDLLQRTARLDTLTGVGNRRAADEALAARLVARLHTEGSGSEQLFVAFVDVDHFKQINDSFGHATGDQVLLALGELMRGFLRNRDEVFRYGGEEFVLLMTDVQASAGQDVCERLRLLIERHDWSRLASELRVTASFGVACWQGDAAASDLLARADAAMYRAKREGRNRVVEA